jgi:hypothetical protein
MENETYKSACRLITRGLWMVIKLTGRNADTVIRRYPYAVVVLTVLLASVLTIRSAIVNRTERDATDKKYTMLRMKYDSILAAKSCVKVEHDTIKVFVKPKAKKIINKNDTI